MKEKRKIFFYILLIIFVILVILRIVFSRDTTAASEEEIIPTITITVNTTTPTPTIIKSTLKAIEIIENTPAVTELITEVNIPSFTPTPTSTPIPTNTSTPIPTETLATASNAISAPEPVAQYDNKYGVFSTIGYTPTEQEMMMFCTVVSSETGYCADQVQKAVAHTIINRILSPKFPNNLYEALTQLNQYTAVNDYFTGNYRVGLYPGSDLWNHSMALCYEALNEVDFTNGAFAYYNPHMMGYNAWFESLIFTYEDQYGRFFKF